MQRVIVVGAAVAGSAVANALGQLGVPVLVLEKGAERDNSTRGDILHPPTLAFLQGWGVLDDLIRDGALPLTELAVTSREQGRLATFPIQAQGQGPASQSLAVPHDRIEAVMKAGAERWLSVEMLRATVIGLISDERGRVAGVRARTPAGVEETFFAPLVVGCDGSQSLVRRGLDIPVDRQPYDHEFLYIAADGPTDPPAAMHFYLDPEGVIMVASRPRQRMRIAIYFARGSRGDLLKRPDPALHAYVAGRVPQLASARFGRRQVHVYALTRQLAACFARPGAALVGDAAHTTHPAGATGMNLAISGAARLAELLGPLLLDHSPLSLWERAGVRDLQAIDAQLAAYDAERRPAASAALEHNHRQAMRIWQAGVQHDPEAYVRAVDPNAEWGVGGAGWGKDPAALGSGRRL
jgi:2-polyprenyl-6-methoxyphenol hydroxylase-like FAD-dependent oxidoreductase